MEKKVFCDKCGRKSPWKPSKINGRWVMTRLNGNAVEGRRMDWIQRIRYFYMKNDATAKENT